MFQHIFNNILIICFIFSYFLSDDEKKLLPNLRFKIRIIMADQQVNFNLFSKIFRYNKIWNFFFTFLFFSFLKMLKQHILTEMYNLLRIFRSFWNNYFLYFCYYIQNWRVNFVIKVPLRYFYFKYPQKSRNRIIKTIVKDIPIL